MNLPKAIILAIAFLSQSRAAISFEEFSPSGGNFFTPPDGYQGLNWRGFEVYDGTFFPEGSPLRDGIVTGRNVALARGAATLTADDPFTLKSAWFTASAPIGVTVTFWRGANRVWLERFAAEPNRAQHVFPLLEDVTRVEIAGGVNGIVIDDIDLEPPLPGQTITFDELSPIPGGMTPITNGFWGLHWSGFTAADATTWPADSLERNALVSGQNVAILRLSSGTISSGRPFSLRSLWLTAAASGAVTISASRGDTHLGSWPFTVETRPTLIAVNIERATAVTILSSGGRLVIDDLQVALRAEQNSPSHPFFEAGPIFYPTIESSRVVAADFNGDGRNDLAMAGRIELGAADGGFESQPGADRVGSPITAGDFTGDGRADIIAQGYTMTYERSYIAFDDAGAMQIAQLPYSNGSIAFGDFLSRNWIYVASNETAAGDFNGDERLDYVAVDPNKVTFFRNTGGEFSQSFQTSVEQNRSSIVALDYDRDGDLDLATAYISRGAIGILANDGNGNFAPPFFAPAGVARPKNLAVNDLDGDGLADLIVRTALSEVVILHGLRAGGFAPAVQIIGPLEVEESAAAQGNFLAVNDLNGDGTPDIAFLRGTEIAVLFNKTPPRLNISRAGDLPEIRWLREFSGGAVLETSTSLDGAIWEVHRFPPLRIGEESVAYDSGSAPTRFFRLRKPR